MRITTPYPHPQRPRHPEVADARSMNTSRRPGVGGAPVRLGRVWLAWALVLSVLFGLLPGLASASPDRVGHVRSKMSLSQAPAGLQAAVSSTLGASATTAGSAFQRAKLTASDGAAGDSFASSVAINGSIAVVGAPYKNAGMGAAYVFVHTSTGWSQQAELTASDGAYSDEFGFSVSIYGSTAVIGAYARHSGMGAAYVFVHTSTGWSQQAELTAKGGASGDDFGRSVAVYGSTAVIGAVGANSAYVFVQSTTGWSQQAKLIASDGTSGDGFGGSVAISGSTAVVGASWSGNTGAAYVFVHTSTGWTQQAKLTASDAAGGDRFGESVAISGSRAVVGAPSKNSGTGAAYEFVRSGTSWSQDGGEMITQDLAAGDGFGHSVAISGPIVVVGAYGKNSYTGAAYVFATLSMRQEAELTASDATANDRFGSSVAISGSTLVVGAYGKNSNTGAAYAFALPSQQAKLTASDAAARDDFGLSVAISGSTAVVGAPQKNSATGAAYVFVNSGGVWSQQAKLTASDGAFYDTFGVSVALYGSTAVIGATGNNSQSGAAYVFVRSGTTWSQQAELTDPAATGGDLFGNSVAIYGSTVIIGAPSTNSSTGAAYVFVHSTTGWSQQAKLTASDAADGDNFGYSVGIYGSTAVIGAPNNRSVTGAANAGAAYVFVHSTSGWSQQTQLIDPAVNHDDFFGNSVAINGTTVIAGAPGTNSSTGAAYVFTPTGTSWAVYTLSPSDSGGDFGQSVAISGSTAVVGAPAWNSTTGEAYVFARSGTTWSQQAVLGGSDSVARDGFGDQVALSGSTAIMGAPFKNSSTGAAYVFANM